MRTYTETHKQTLNYNPRKFSAYWHFVNEISRFPPIVHYKIYNNMWNVHSMPPILLITPLWMHDIRRCFIFRRVNFSRHIIATKKNRLFITLSLEVVLVLIFTEPHQISWIMWIGWEKKRGLHLLLWFSKGFWSYSRKIFMNRTPESRISFAKGDTRALWKKRIVLYITFPIFEENKLTRHLYESVNAICI